MSKMQCIICHSSPLSHLAANYAGRKIKGTERYYPGKIGVDFLCRDCVSTGLTDSKKEMISSTKQSEQFKALSELARQQEETDHESPAVPVIADVESNQHSESLQSEAQVEVSLVEPLEEDDNSKPIRNRTVGLDRNLLGGILITTGIVILSIFITFSVKYIPQFGFIGSMPYMELQVGKWVCKNEGFPLFDARKIAPGEYDCLGVPTDNLKHTGFIIPTRYGLVFGVFFISLGTTIRRYSRRLIHRDNTTEYNSVRLS